MSIFKEVKEHLSIKEVMGADETIKKAEYVLNKLKTYYEPYVKRRDVFRDCRGTYFKNVADLKPILDFLEEYGYIRKQLKAINANLSSQLQKEKSMSHRLSMKSLQAEIYELRRFKQKAEEFMKKRGIYDYFHKSGIDLNKIEL